jgi:hypothetical protein
MISERERSPTRREALLLFGGLATTTGCTAPQAGPGRDGTGEAGSGSGSERGGRADAERGEAASAASGPGTVAWSMFGRDAAHAGYVPDGGPDGESPEMAWRAAVAIEWGDVGTNGSPPRRTRSAGLGREVSLTNDRSSLTNNSPRRGELGVPPRGAIVTPLPLSRSLVMY